MSETPTKDRVGMTAQATERPATAKKRALRVTIPGCPARALNPNEQRRNHWSVKRQAIQVARAAAYYATRDALGPDGMADPARRLVIDAVIGWGRGRKRMDETNLPATLKPTLDGIADCLMIDDKQFVWGEVRQTRATPGDRAGWIELTVTEADE